MSNACFTVCMNQSGSASNFLITLLCIFCNRSVLAALDMQLTGLECSVCYRQTEEEEEALEASRHQYVAAAMGVAAKEDTPPATAGNAAGESSLPATPSPPCSPIKAPTSVPPQQRQSSRLSGRVQPVSSAAPAPHASVSGLPGGLQAGGSSTSNQQCAIGSACSGMGVGWGPMQLGAAYGQ